MGTGAARTTAGLLALAMIAISLVSGASAASAAALQPGSIFDGFNPGSTITDRVTVVQPVQVGAEQKYLVGGDFSNVGGNDHLVMLNADGTVYPDFSPGSILNNVVHSIQEITVAGVTKYLIGGSFTDVDSSGNDRLVILNSDGSRYSGFNPGTVLGAEVDDAKSVIVNGVQKYVAVGGFQNAGPDNNDSALILNADGTVYSDFRPGSTFADVTSYSVVPIEVDGQQKYLIGTHAALSGRFVTILNEDGSTYSGFSPQTEYSTSSAYDVAALTIDGEQKYLAAGQLMNADASIRNGAVIFNRDGSVYSRFKPPSELLAFAASVVPLGSEPGILISGGFDSGSGLIGRLLVLRLDGSIVDQFQTGNEFESSPTLSVGSVSVGGQIKYWAGGGFTAVGSADNDYVTLINGLMVPVVASEAASKISPTTALGHGRLTTGGAESSADIHCRVATSPAGLNSGRSFPASPSTFGPEAAQLPLTCPMTGLKPGTTYHYRFYAPSISGDGTSPIVSFRTTKRKQTLRAGTIPKQIKCNASTVVNKRKATTKQRRPLRAQVQVIAARGDVSAIRVIRGPARQVVVRSYGCPAVRIKVTYKAPGNATYKALRKTKTYRL